MLVHLALRIHQELCKVPRDVSTLKAGVSSKVIVGLMSVGSLDVDFAHHGEGDSVLIDEFLNVLWGSWLLATELVAGEAQDLQPLGVVSGVDLN